MFLNKTVWPLINSMSSANPGCHPRAVHDIPFAGWFPRYFFADDRIESR